MSVVQLSFGLVPERPSSPVLRYFGGKWRIASWVARHLPRHTTYVEPFGGAASVLLRKWPSDVEVYNDRAAAVVNFFRVLRDDGDELVRQLECTPFAFDEYLAAREQAGDPLERARRFFVRSWGGYGGISGHTTDGKLRSTGWRRNPERGCAREFVGAVESLQAARDRLRLVAIENLDWREILERYDSPGTCLYVDPPYVPSERKRICPSDGYGDNELSESDHVELCEALCRVQGAVVLSGYDNPIYRERLEGWRSDSVTSATQAASRTETIWIKR